jgi:hypothetical protein
LSDEEIAKAREYLERHGIEVLRVTRLKNATRIYIRKKEAEL